MSARDALPNVFGDAVTFTSQRGREWLLLVVRCCPACRDAHVHIAAAGATVVRRAAPCQAGSYDVHAVDRISR